MQRAQRINAAVNAANKTAVVFGGTSGIGEGIAHRLAQANVSVTIVGRNQQRGADIVAQLQQEGSGQHRFVACDATLINDIRAFGAEYSAKHDSLDYLVMSQGMATVQGYTPSAEGIDVKLALHYYGRVQLVREMIPLLQNSDDPRVLSVLSGGVHGAYQEYKEDPDLSKNFSLMKAANSAGMYNDIAADKLSELNPKISFTHAAPGAVKTRWGTEMPWILRGPIRFLQLFLKTPATCAEFMCVALFDPDMKGGFHVMNESGRPASKTSLHDEAKEFVWNHTLTTLDNALTHSARSDDN